MSDSHSEISEVLKTALPWLKNAYDTGETVGLKESNYELLQALGDALTACTDALERIDDAPDEVCDVAVELVMRRNAWLLAQEQDKTHELNAKAHNKH